MEVQGRWGADDNGSVFVVLVVLCDVENVVVFEVDVVVGWGVESAVV